METPRHEEPSSSRELAEEVTFEEVPRNEFGGVLVTRDQIRSAFDFFDVERKGKVTMDNLKSRLNFFYPEMITRDFRILLNNTGELTEQDLCNLLLENDITDFDPVAEAFKAYDPEGTGYVDFQMLSRLFEKLGYGRLNDDDLKVLIATADKDKDGRLNLSDFRSMLTINKPIIAGKITLHYFHSAAMENLLLDELQDFLKYPITLANAAIIGGHLCLLKFLEEKYSVELDRVNYICSNFNNGFALDIAGKYGHLDMVKFLLAIGNKSCTTEAIDDAADHAAQYGHFEIIKLLNETHVDGKWEKAMDLAAAGSHTSIVIYLRTNRSEGCTTKAIDSAATRHMDKVKYLHQHRNEGCTTNAMDKAAGAGHLDIVKFLHQHRTEGCTKRACDAAARLGHFDVVQYLLEHCQDDNEANTIIRAGF
ncbi:hypothetical protein THRCLA_02052 [Thraustotheca clavata]|uniref:EF-hand domain-containing protein n=1 Tax=Thraustotheca clavata TaxID=74557 RepID=A0A1W0A6G7_9STRA|nr:hypothetical protein THRCLA_02052 [Thraustotheca clavata]